MAEKRSCGKHVELASNASIRITQCPCGTLHVALHASNLTLRMNEEQLKASTAAFLSATDKIDEGARPTIN